MKKEFWKKLTAYAVVLSMVFGLAACGGKSDTEYASDEVIVAMGQSSEPEAGFDPAYGWGAGEHVHEPLIQSTLTVTTTELGIDYDLATDIDVSDDGLLWTVTIRDDVYFTDGEKLTASDVAFTYNTVRDKSTVNDFTMLDEAVAVNDTTVEFRMNRAYSIWPYSMAVVGIIPEHAYDESYGMNPIGSGRYIMKQWDKGQQIILEANPNYYGEAPVMKKVTIVFMAEDAAFAAVKAGKVDVAYTAATYSNQTVKGYSLMAVQSVDNRGISLPTIPDNGEKGNDVTTDIAIRRAINIGIDRELLIDNVLNGYGTAAYSVCDGMPWFSSDSIVTYDFDEARKILDEAGWKVGDDGVRSKDGVRAEINIMYAAGDSVRQAIAAEFTNQLARLGISATYEGVGWDTAYERAQREPMVWGWGAHTPMEVYNIYHSTTADGLAEYSPYANTEADRLMDDALTESDLETSYELWQAAQAVAAEDVPWVWIANIDHLYWVHDGLKIAEQKIHPHGHGWSIVNNVDKWSR